jgi:hypothetical protein
MKLKLKHLPPDDMDASWFEDAEIWGSELIDRELALNARNFWELESLVRVLDTMETVASLAQLTRE